MARKASDVSARQGPELVDPSRITDVHRSGGLRQIDMPFTSHPTTALWFLMAADLATVVWMYSVGSWLDQNSRLTATSTLGGHHDVVLLIAAIGFMMLAALAVLTDGFSRWSPRLALVRNVACVISVMALTGLVTLILASMLFRLIFGRLRP